MLKRLSAALQNAAQSTCEKLWVQGSAVLCFIAPFVAFCYPATCAYGVIAVAAACVELGWTFWLLLPDTTCAAVACVTCCRWLFQTITDALRRIWSASSSSLSHGAKDTVSSFQRLVNSHLSKPTAFFRHTLSGALRQLKALLWFSTIYPLTLFLEVRFYLCNSCLCPTCCRHGPVWPAAEQCFSCRVLYSSCRSGPSASSRDASSQLLAGVYMSSTWCALVASVLPFGLPWGLEPSLMPRLHHR